MQLEMFVAVVEERSVGKAAARVCRTQPAVSLALSKLEREIGAPVLDRSRHRDYRPTEPGQLLYDYASRIIHLRNEVVSLLQGEDDDSTGCLRIAVEGGPGLQWVTQITNAFHQRYSVVRIQIVCDRPENYVSDLLDRKVDIAFVSVPPDDRNASRELVVARMSQAPPLWMVERRIGRSHLTRVFEEVMTTVASTGPRPDRLNGSRRRPGNTSRRVLGAKSSLSNGGK